VGESPCDLASANYLNRKDKNRSFRQHDSFYKIIALYFIYFLWLKSLERAKNPVVFYALFDESLWRETMSID
jgi:hypothetical protein